MANPRENGDATGAEPAKETVETPVQKDPAQTERDPILAPRVHPLLAQGSPINDNRDDKIELQLEPRAPRTAPKKIGGKVLSAVFNMAAGAALTAAAKAAVISTMTWAAAPAVATLVLSSFAVGAASASFQYWQRARKAKREGALAPAFFSAATGKSFLISSGFALVGGALFLGFEHQIKAAVGGIVHWFNPVHHTAAVVPAAPVCASALDRAHDVIAHTTGVSQQVQDALTRSASHNAHVAGQGTKDLAYYTYNGIGGVHKDATLAANLFEKAASAGNVQAKIDLLYLQHHGLAGITASPAVSAQQMAQIHTPRASHLAKAWHAAAGKGKVPAFDAKAIVSSVKGICLK